jgi:hypothetical protein
VPRPSPLRRPTLPRRIARAAAGLLAFALAALLALQLFLWVGIRNEWRLRLPGFAVRFIVNCINRPGMELRCGNVFFHPSGALEAEDVEIGASEAYAPNFTIRRAAASASLPQLLRGKLVLKHALVDGAAFYCPATVAPDGRRHVVLNEIRAVLDRESGGWMRVRTLQARCGEIPVMLQGEFLPPSLRWEHDSADEKDARKSKKKWEKRWRSINKIAVQIHETRPRLDALGKFAVEINGQGDDSGSVLLSLLLRAETLTPDTPAGLRATGARITARARFDGEHFLPEGAAVLSAKSVEWHGAAAAADTTTTSSAARAARNITVVTGPVRFTGALGAKGTPPTEIRFAAQDIHLNWNPTPLPIASAVLPVYGEGASPLAIASAVLPLSGEGMPHATASSVPPPIAARQAPPAPAAAFSEHLDFLDGTLRWDAFPFVEARARVVSAGDHLEARARAHLLRNTLDTAFTANLAPAAYLARPGVRRLLPPKLATLALHQQLEVGGTARLGSNFKFREAALNFATGAADLAGFHITTARGRLRLTPENIELFDAAVHSPLHRAHGGFRTEFAKGGEFRLLLNGTTNPTLLGTFLGEGWANIWRQFDLRDDSLPRADIEVRAHWGTPHEVIHCAAAGENITFRGASFDKVELRILETPARIALHGMRVWQGDHTAAGTFQLHYTPLPAHKRHSFRFHFDGTLPKDTCAALAGPELQRRLAPLEAERAVEADVTGHIHGPGSPTPERDQVLVRANIPGPFTAWNLDLADFTGSVAYDSGVALVTIEDAAFAAGRIGQNPAPWSSTRAADQPQRLWLDLRHDAPRLFLDIEILAARRTKLTQSLKKLSEATAPLSIASAVLPIYGEGASPLPIASAVLPIYGEGTSPLSIASAVLPIYGEGTSHATASSVPPPIAARQVPPTTTATGTTTPATTPATAAAAASTTTPTTSPATTTAPEAPSAPAPPPDSSSLDIIFTGSLTLPHIETLEGTGSARLWDPALPKLHLFGGLSRVFDKIGFTASSFRMDRARSDFSVSARKIHFPNIEILGDGSLINSVGTYDLPTGKLDFRAQLSVSPAEGILGVQQVMETIYKWTQLVPVNIRGTLDDPDWSLDPTPTALFKDPLEKKKKKLPPAP